MTPQLIDYGKIGTALLHNLPLILSLIVLLVAITVAVAAIQAAMELLAPIFAAILVVGLVVRAIGPLKVLYWLEIGAGVALAVAAIYLGFHKVRDLMPVKAPNDRE